MVCHIRILYMIHVRGSTAPPIVSPRASLSPHPTCIIAIAGPRWLTLNSAIRGMSKEITKDGIQWVLEEEGGFLLQVQLWFSTVFNNIFVFFSTGSHKFSGEPGGAGACWLLLGYQPATHGPEKQNHQVRVSPTVGWFTVRHDDLWYHNFDIFWSITRCKQLLWRIPPAMPMAQGFSAEWH